MFLCCFLLLLLLYKTAWYCDSWENKNRPAERES